MATYLQRPLPMPPSYATGDYIRRDDVNTLTTEQYQRSYSFFPYTYSPHPAREPAVNSEAISNNSYLRGTLLHRGFYDLLALIPSTPSPSRFFWGGNQREELLAGPKYDNSNPPSHPPNSGYIPSRPPPVSPPSSPQKGRRISKDMVSRPTGFVYLLFFYP